MILDKAKQPVPCPIKMTFPKRPAFESLFFRLAINPIPGNRTELTERCYPRHREPFSAPFQLQPALSTIVHELALDPFEGNDETYVEVSWRSRWTRAHIDVDNSVLFLLHRPIQNQSTRIQLCVVISDSDQGEGVKRDLRLASIPFRDQR